MRNDDPWYDTRQKAWHVPKQARPYSDQMAVARKLLSLARQLKLAALMFALVAVVAGLGYWMGWW